MEIYTLSSKYTNDVIKGGQQQFLSKEENEFQINVYEQ